MFRLEPVLRYRHRMVDMAQQDLFTLETALSNATQSLEELRLLHAKRLHALRRHQEGADIDVEEVRRRLMDISRLALLDQEQMSVVAELRAAVAEKRQDLVTRSQEEQVLERLKKRHLARDHEAVARREHQAIDEAGLLGFLRQRKVE